LSIKSPWAEVTALLASILWQKVSSQVFSRMPRETGSFLEHFFHQDMRKNRIFAKGGIQVKGNIFISWQPQQKARGVSKERR